MATNSKARGLSLSTRRTKPRGQETQVVYRRSEYFSCESAAPEKAKPQVVVEVQRQEQRQNGAASTTTHLHPTQSSCQSRSVAMSTTFSSLAHTITEHSNSKRCEKGTGSSMDEEDDDSGPDVQEIDMKMHTSTVRERQDQARKGDLVKAPAIDSTFLCSPSPHGVNRRNGADVDDGGGGGRRSEIGIGYDDHETSESLGSPLESSTVLQVGLSSSVHDEVDGATSDNLASPQIAVDGIHACASHRVASTLHITRDTNPASALTLKSPPRTSQPDSPSDFPLTHTASAQHVQPPSTQQVVHELLSSPKCPVCQERFEDVLSPRKRTKHVEGCLGVFTHQPQRSVEALAADSSLTMPCQPPHFANRNEHSQGATIATLSKTPDLPQHQQHPPPLLASIPVTSDKHVQSNIGPADALTTLIPRTEKPTVDTSTQVDTRPVHMHQSLCDSTATDPSIQRRQFRSERKANEANTIPFQKRPDQDLDNSLQCPVCDTSIQHLSTHRKRVHLNACLDQTANEKRPVSRSSCASSRAGRTRDKSPSLAVTCPICTMPQPSKSKRSFVLHLKSCAKLNNVAPRDLVALMRPILKQLASQAPTKSSRKSSPESISRNPCGASGPSSSRSSDSEGESGGSSKVDAGDSDYDRVRARQSLGSRRTGTFCTGLKGFKTTSAQVRQPSSDSDTDSDAPLPRVDLSSAHDRRLRQLRFHRSTRDTLSAPAPQQSGAINTSTLDNSDSDVEFVATSKALVRKAAKAKTSALATLTNTPTKQQRSRSVPCDGGGNGGGDFTKKKSRKQPTVSRVNSSKGSNRGSRKKALLVKAESAPLLTHDPQAYHATLQQRISAIVTEVRYSVPQMHTSVPSPQPSATWAMMSGVSALSTGAYHVPVIRRSSMTDHSVFAPSSNAAGATPNTTTTISADIPSRKSLCKSSTESPSDVTVASIRCGHKETVPGNVFDETGNMINSLNTDEESPSTDIKTSMATYLELGVFQSQRFEHVSLTPQTPRRNSRVATTKAMERSSTDDSLLNEQPLSRSQSCPPNPCTKPSIDGGHTVSEIQGAGEKDMMKAHCGKTDILVNNPLESGDDHDGGALSPDMFSLSSDSLCSNPVQVKSANISPRPDVLVRSQTVLQCMYGVLTSVAGSFSWETSDGFEVAVPDGLIGFVASVVDVSDGDDGAEGQRVEEGKDQPFLSCVFAHECVLAAAVPEWHRWLVQLVKDKRNYEVTAKAETRPTLAPLNTVFDSVSRTKFCIVQPELLTLADLTYAMHFMYCVSTPPPEHIGLDGLHRLNEFAEAFRWTELAAHCQLLQQSSTTHEPVTASADVTRPCDYFCYLPSGLKRDQACTYSPSRVRSAKQSSGRVTFAAAQDDVEGDADSQASIGLLGKDVEEPYLHVSSTSSSASSPTSSCPSLDLRMTQAAARRPHATSTTSACRSPALSPTDRASSNSAAHSVGRGTIPLVKTHGQPPVASHTARQSHNNCAALVALAAPADVSVSTDERLLQAIRCHPPLYKAVLLLEPIPLSVLVDFAKVTLGKQVNSLDVEEFCNNHGITFTKPSVARTRAKSRAPKKGSRKGTAPRKRRKAPQTQPSQQTQGPQA
eukprot:m.312157 g.312157  ORF g.312157 m.312157 type:complete len:1592 (-) comp15966_c1_seq1:384-5159(-)